MDFPRNEDAINRLSVLACRSKRDAYGVQNMTHRLYGVLIFGLVLGCSTSDPVPLPAIRLPEELIETCEQAMALSYSTKASMSELQVAEHVSAAESMWSATAWKSVFECRESTSTRSHRRRSRRALARAAAALKEQVVTY